MKILVACETSGRTRQAFRKLGHDAWSCDILPSDDNSKYHVQDDVLNLLDDNWDLMLAHPPCTYLTVSANKWHKPEYKDRFPTREQDRLAAIDFFMAMINAPIPRIAVENPIGIMSTRYRKPDQIIQPWQFGHPETKATCLWLKNLPKLAPTNIVKLPKNRSEKMKIFYLPPSLDRWKLRSLTFQGIADAIAAQWGNLKDNVFYPKFN